MYLRNMERYFFDRFTNTGPISKDGYSKAYSDICATWKMIRQIINMIIEIRKKFDPKSIKVYS